MNLPLIFPARAGNIRHEPGRKAPKTLERVGLMVKNIRLVPEHVENTLDAMKYEIASEFGVRLGADTTARQNGKVGGEMTKRLVEIAKSQLGQ